MTWYAKLGGRKFMGFAFVLLTATASFNLEKLSESGYITLVSLVFATFGAANVTQKATRKETTE